MTAAKAAAPIEITTTVAGCRKRIRPSPRYGVREVHGDERQEPGSPTGRPRSLSTAPARDSQGFEKAEGESTEHASPRVGQPADDCPRKSFQRDRKADEADAIGAMRKPLKPARAELSKNG